MAVYEVHGHVTVICGMKVEAESEEEAIEIANATFGGLSNYAGNGECEYLLDVDSTEDDRCIFPDGEVEFDDAQEV